MVNRELRRSQEKTASVAQRERQVAARKKAAEKKRAERKAGKKGFFKSIKQFLHDVRIEMRKVIWPSREDVFNYTCVVVITVAVVTTFTLVLDWGLMQLLNILLGT